MAGTEEKSNERVVRLMEVCGRVVMRVFYCIYDTQFRHWMSDEPFEGAIWTKDVRCRREFNSRREAKDALSDLMEWRDERDDQPSLLDEIPFKREAA